MSRRLRGLWTKLSSLGRKTALVLLRHSLFNKFIVEIIFIELVLICSLSHELSIKKISLIKGCNKLLLHDMYDFALVLKLSKRSETNYSKSNQRKLYKTLLLNKIVRLF